MISEFIQQSAWAEAALTFAVTVLVLSFSLLLVIIAYKIFKDEI